MGHDFGEGGDDLKMGGFVSYPFLGSFKMGKISAQHESVSFSKDQKCISSV